ncbi:discoidin domain-containing protein [Rapidithrix thailandica]|uniref:Discoidin domain-containing protein n=1 Tax=Rapidithrix thailandica TaxID=413964 RepID=A0AAW9RVN0_9BACT
MKKLAYYIPLLFLCFCSLIACSEKDQLEVIDKEEPEGQSPEEPVDLGNFTSDHQHNLNVIYFVPADIEPLERYHERLSGVMLYMQDWYAQEMARYGFDKTFGLLKSEVDPSYVKVLVIRGKNNQEYYPYEGGGSKAIQEIKEYFEQHPEDNHGAHTLVFMPSREGDNGWNAGGVPFYGLGKWCFALDYKNFDMKYFGSNSKEADDHWIGGTIHELGHGLNLPHNKHKATDNWISMMAWGNHEFASAPENVRFTLADALILNNNQIVNKNSAVTYYTQTPEFNLKAMRIYADAQNLYVSGKFETDVPVNGVIVYNDPKTSESDADYNAVTWGTKQIEPDNSFSLTMPLEGIDKDFQQYPFELRIRFCHENGNFTVQKYSYQFQSGRPDIDIHLKEVEELPKDTWSVIAVSSEELVGEGADNGAAAYLIDQDAASFWHSQWYQAKPDYPHSFTVDMGATHEVKGLVFDQRGEKYNGRVKDYTLEVSNDNTSWTKVGDFTLSDAQRIVKDLDMSQTFRYFKITIISGYDNGSGENVFFTHLAEIGVY